MGEERTALFVRVPTSLATELDTRAESLGRSKQAMVTDILTNGIADSPNADHGDHMVADVLDLEEVAAMLRIETSEVMERIESGNFPARRFGEANWRFSRQAVSAWLAGTDPVNDRRTGFEPAAR